MKVVLVVGSTYRKGDKLYKNGEPMEAGEDTKYLLGLENTEGQRRFVAASEFKKKVKIQKPDIELDDDVGNIEPKAEEVTPEEINETGDSGDESDKGEGEENETGDEDKTGNEDETVDV